VARALAVPSTLVGAYVALCYFAAMLSSLVGGTLVRRLGAIRVSQLGLGLCAVGLALCALPWLPAVALGALCIGAGYGPITPASSHLLALTTPAHRMSLVFSIKQTGVPAGGMLAGALVPGLSLWLGWQGTLLAVAGVCALCAALAQPLRAALDADRQPAQPLALQALFKPIGMVLGHPSLRALAACSFLFSAVQVSTTAYMVTYLNESLGMTLLAAGAALSVSQLAGVVGRIAWGAVADRGLGPRNTLMLLATRHIGDVPVPEGGRQSRLLLAGDADFANNSQFALVGNGMLFVNAINALAQQDALIDIRPRHYETRSVQLTNRQMRTVFIVSSVLLPALALAFGAWTWWRRR